MAKRGGFPGGMPGNMNNLMKQAQKMQKQMEENQRALEEKEFTAAAGGGAVGMGIATGKAVEGISRQPEVEGKIRTNFMLGIVFMETAIIYALLVIILIIFVI